LGALFFPVLPAGYGGTFQLLENLPSILPPPPIGRNTVDKEEEEDIKHQLVEKLPTAIDKELREECREADIGPGAGSRLASLDGVTAQRVRWILADTRARHRGENVTGLVVRRLLDGDPMPEEGSQGSAHLPLAGSRRRPLPFTPIRSPCRRTCAARESGERNAMPKDNA